MKRYRLITGIDDSKFCQRVSEALAEGWELYGSPSISNKNNETICAQAITKEIAPEKSHTDK